MIALNRPLVFHVTQLRLYYPIYNTNLKMNILSLLLLSLETVLKTLFKFVFVNVTFFSLPITFSLPNPGFVIYFFKPRTMFSPMLKTKEKHHCAYSIERQFLTLLTIFKNAKKGLLNLAKPLQYKVGQTYVTFLQ